MGHELTAEQRKSDYRVNTVAVPWWATATLRMVALTLIVSAFPLSTAKAGQRCWPLDKVMDAHAEQGDEIVLTFRSRMREGSFTIIYLDPSDGVVTEVAIDSNGVACIFDVGEGLRVRQPGRAIVVDGAN